MNFLNNIFKRFTKKRDYVTDTRKQILKKPSLVDISKKVLEKEKERDQMRSQLKLRLQNLENKYKDTLDF